MYPRLIPAAFLGVALAACGGDKTNQLKPNIALFDDGKPTPKPLTELDFGAVSVGKPKAADFSIHSVNQVALTVTGIRFEDDDGKSAKGYAAVLPAHFPAQVPAGGQLPAQISLTPDDVRAFPARMVVLSDDPNHPQVKVRLTGLGIAGALDLSACINGETCATTSVEAPGPLPVGPVTVGDRADIDVVLRNTGKDTLDVTSIAFADPAAAGADGFGFTGTPPTSVAALSSRAVSIAYTPPAPETSTVGVVVTTSDRDHPTMRIDLAATAVPNGVPLACAYVAKILHFRTGELQMLQPGDTVPVIEPLDTVTISASVRAGCSADPEDGTAISYLWTVTGPQPSTDTNPALVLRPPRSGTYTIDLSVKDHLGAIGTADDAGHPAEIVLDVHPTTDIAAEVSWGADASPEQMPETDIDLDLHFMRGLAAPYGNDDCVKPLSEVDSSCGLHWGTLTDTTDDPHHSPDDTGFGDLVESATLDGPEKKTYYVVVNYFNDRRQLTGAATCTMDQDCTGDAPECIDGTCRTPVYAKARVYIKGVLATEISINPQTPLAHPCDEWVAASIDWSQTPPVVTPTNVVQPDPDFGTIQGPACVPPGH